MIGFPRAFDHDAFLGSIRDNLPGRVDIQSRNGPMSTIPLKGLGVPKGNRHDRKDTWFRFRKIARQGVNP
jgi:hypothetical protein